MSNVLQNRIPPHNKDAELSVLGSVLLNGQALAFVRPIIGPEHFYVEAHGLVFRSMCELADAKQPIDAVTLGAKLKATGDLEKIGATFFSEITNEIVTSANAEYYAKIVRELHSRRAMIRAASEIMARGYDEDDDTTQYLSSSADLVARVTQQLRIAKGPQQIDEDLIEIYHELEVKEEPIGLIKTGIDSIDVTTGGLWPGQTTVLGAPPGMGKSALALNIGVNVSLSEKQVLYIPLEDTRKQLVRRMLSRFADIDAQALGLNQVGADEWPRLVSATAHLSGKKPFWIEDTAGLSSAAIRSIVIAHKMQHGLDLLIVDHMGDVAEKKYRGESETDRASRVITGLRDLGKELNIANLVLCQLNRNLELRSDKRPNRSDLKQTGRIEEVARAIWFLFRPGVYEGNNDRTDAQLIINKTNHGKPGMIPLWMNLSRMHVRGWDRMLDGVFPEYLPDGSKQEQTKQKNNEYRQRMDIDGY